MINWKDYVGYQPVDAKDGIIFFIKLTDIKDEEFTFSVLKQKFTEDEYTLTYDEVGKEVERILGHFPDYNDRKELPMESRLQALKMLVGANTRRGLANTNYKNIWFYKGPRSMDSPIMVQSNGNGLYVVFKHPDFVKYGFRLT